MKEVEEPYFDEHGREIKEFSLLKIYHFTGKRKKRYYMYHWVRLRELMGRLCWTAVHLNDDKGQWYFLQAVADRDTRFINGYELIQEPYISP